MIGITNVTGDEMMRTALFSGLFIAASVFFSASVMAQEAEEAQEAQQPPPNVCAENPEFDQWDFWLGDWNVYSNNEEKTLLGTNSITKHYHECLIKENWVDAQGNGGFSMNFYNPVKGHWRQVWVSNGYFIDYTGGLNEAGQMVLEGEVDQYAPGTTTRFKGIWTPEDNGDVIQQFDTFNAETGEWTRVFEARYIKQ